MRDIFDVRRIAIGGLLCGLAVLPVTAQDSAAVSRVADNTAAIVALAKDATGLNDGDFSVRAEIGAVSTLTDTETAVKPTAWIEANMPLGFAVATARLGLTARPGENIDLTAVETFKDAELGLALTHYFRQHGASRIGATVEAGFSTAQDEGGDPEAVQPYERLSRYAGAGLNFTHTSGADLTILWGLDESTGEDFGWGDLLLYGRLPVVGTKGILVLNGDVAINLGPRTNSENLPQQFRDVWKIGVVLDATAVIDALK